MTQETALRKRVYGASAASMFIFSASSIALPISLVRISAELGLNLTQAGSLGFVASLEQFVVLLGSSFVAARFGKIRVLRTGLIILSAGLLLFTLSRSWLAAAAIMLFIGLGNGLLEALLTPIVEDLYPADNGSKMNLLHAFWPVGTCVTVLVFGELLSLDISWRHLFLALAAAVLLVNFLFPSSRKVQLPRSRADFSHMKEILAVPRFWLLGFALCFAGGAEAAFAFWSASYIQLNFAALPRAGGIGTACFAAGMAIGRLASSRLAGRFGLQKLLLGSGILGLASSLMFFSIRSLPTLYAFLALMGLAVACLWPSIQSYSARVIQVDPTILMIFLSCFGIPGYSSATLIMGMLGDAYGLQRSFIIAPLYLGLMVVLLLIDSRLPRTSGLKAAA